MIDFELLKSPKNVPMIPTYITFYQLKMVVFLFFLSSDMHQSNYFIGCHATGINSLVICFLHALRYLNLLRQAIGLT